MVLPKSYNAWLWKAEDPDQISELWWKLSEASKRRVACKLLLDFVNHGLHCEFRMGLVNVQCKW